jgi:hypothetical protein
MSRHLRQWLVATLLVVTAFSAGVPIGPAAGAADTPATDTTTGTPMGTSGNFPTEMVAVALAVTGIVLAGVGALAFRRGREPDDTGETGPETRRNR